MTTKIITVSSQKGGTGKTTTATTLGHGLALKGKRVLIIDTDPQGQSATFLNVEKADGVYYYLTKEKSAKETICPARKNLWIIPGHKKTVRVMDTWKAISGGEPPADRLARMIAPLTGALDYIIIDTGPTAGGLQDQAIYAADGVIIPAMPDYAAAQGVSEVWNTLQVHKANGWRGRVIGVLPTMYRVTAEADATMTDYERIYGDFVLQRIHDTVIFRECVSAGITIWEKGGKEPTLTRAMREYQALVDLVLEVM